MDWFERITGFAESDYEGTRSRLRVEGEWLVSDAHSRRWSVGRLALPTLASLRERSAALPRVGGQTVQCVQADARELHRDPANAGAVFQVASQFNLLEMTSASVSPEDGVTRYRYDATQGPACAMAAGAATIYRNYLVPCGDGFGQTRMRQLDTLGQLGLALSQSLVRPVHALWTMRNGYALASPDGLHAIGKLLQRLGESDRDVLRSALAVGCHQDVHVTDMEHASAHRVTQIFCSALPVSYTTLPAAQWEPFARLVLEAAYEATLLAAALGHARGGSNRVFLTSLGGGAFGNDPRWIDDAMERALQAAAPWGLDVRIVSFSGVRPAHQAIAERFGRA